MSRVRVDSPQALAQVPAPEAGLLRVPASSAVAYAVSFFLPLLANSKALVVKYDGEYFFPVGSYHAATRFRAHDVSAKPTTAS